MINNVVLVGRMTRDANLRYTPSNVAVATFTLAVNRPFKKDDGNREADFINCVIWRKSAENLSNWAKKGALIAIEGRIQTRNYENQQGQRVYVTEVVVDNFQLLESRDVREENNGGQVSGGTGYATNPFASDSNNTNNKIPSFEKENTFGPFGGASPLEISDDDLPF